MLRIDEFAQSIDSTGQPKHLDYFDVLRLDGKLDPKRTEKILSRLPDYEQDIYNNYKSRLMTNYNTRWNDILTSQTRFKKPFMANG